MARNTPVIVSVADTINLATLSATLGPSTREEARALAPEETDEALVELGNSVSTERVDDDALRILHAAAEFFTTASKERKAKVYLSPEFVRVAAWSALQGHDAWSASATRRSVKAHLPHPSVHLPDPGRRRRRSGQDGGWRPATSSNSRSSRIHPSSRNSLATRGGSFVTTR